MTDDQPSVDLNSGHSMPQLGFGVFKVPPDEVQRAVSVALETGYRSIDTAAMYRNEAGVGAAIADSGLPRDELFVTTKLDNPSHREARVEAAFDDSLRALGLDYVDLYLIHWPLPAVDRYVEVWRQLEAIARDGRARSIGVSNFQPAHLERLRTETDVTPAVNQVELHPYLVQTAVREADRTLGIVTEAWSPIAKGGELLTDGTVTGIAEKYGVTPAQIVIRWHLQLGNVVIPKSVTPSRIRENFEVFGFELDEDDVAAISGLDRDGRTGPDPDHFNP
jgi:2,5-diketo-D-gluconate reductase A